MDDLRDQLGDWYRVYAVPLARGSATLGICCDRPRCGWTAHLDDFSTLGELNQRATEHAQVIHHG
jgi:hypothetical protein